MLLTLQKDGGPRGMESSVMSGDRVIRKTLFHKFNKVRVKF